jgi:hypothetical protein
LLVTMGEVDAMESEKSIQVILYHSSLVDYVGKEIDGVQYSCCWQEVYDLGECNNLGNAIVQDEAFSSQYSDRFYYYNVEWTNITVGNTTQFVTVNTVLNQVMKITQIFNKVAIWSFRKWSLVS